MPSSSPGERHSWHSEPGVLTSRHLPHRLMAGGWEDCPPNLFLVIHDQLVTCFRSMGWLLWMGENVLSFKRFCSFKRSGHGLNGIQSCGCRVAFREGPALGSTGPNLQTLLFLLPFLQERSSERLASFGVFFFFSFFLRIRGGIYESDI